MPPKKVQENDRVSLDDLPEISDHLPASSSNQNSKEYRSTLNAKINDLEFENTDSQKAKLLTFGLMNRRATAQFTVSAFGAKSDEEVQADLFFNEKKELLQKYGCENLHKIHLDRWSLGYMNSITNVHLSQFDNLYLGCHCNPEITERCFIVLAILLILMLIKDVVFVAQGQYTALVFIKYLVIFPIIVASIKFLVTTKFFLNSQLIGIPVLIISQAFIIDHVLVKQSVSIGIMAVIYVAASFTTLTTWNNVLLNAINFASYNGLVIVLNQYFLKNVITTAVSENMYNIFFQLVFIVTVGVQTYVFEKEARVNFLKLQVMIQHNKDLRREKKKNEELIRSILPAEVINKMKLNEELMFHYPETTIIFIQICEFARICAVMTPEHLVMFLNTLFSQFDKIIESNFVHKVETVGEVYMAVAGCPMKSTNHAILAANAALSIQEHMPSLTASLKQSIGMLGVKDVQVKIGLHTGTIVAGVVGKKNPRYKLFGDTVNTSSRMESTSEPGKIQCTVQTEQYLRGKYKMQNRGGIAVKGKGLIETFFILDHGENGRIPSIPTFDQRLDAASLTKGGTFKNEHLKNIFDNAVINNNTVDTGGHQIERTSFLTKSFSEKILGNGGDIRRNSLQIQGIEEFEAEPLSRAVSGIVEVDKNFRKILDGIEVAEHKMYHAVNKGKDAISHDVAGQHAAPSLGIPPHETNSKTNHNTMVRNLEKWITRDHSLTVRPEHILHPYEQALLLDKPFQLPEKYQNVFSAVTTLNSDDPLEIEYLQDLLPSLNISYALGVLLIMTIIGSDSLLYTYGSHNVYATCDSQLEATFFNYREIIKYAVILPLSFLLLATTYISRATNKRLTSVFVSLVFFIGIGVISVSLLGLKPNHGIFDFLIISGFHILHIPFRARFAIFFILPCIYVVGVFGLCSNILNKCVANQYNICYSYSPKNGYVFSPGTLAVEFFLYNLVFLFGQSFMSAQREYNSRVRVCRIHQGKKQRQIIEEQAITSFEVLKRLLPTSIATAIKNKKKVVAESFENVTILFTDMKGFTAYSSNQTAANLMRFLDRMFTTFDEISNKYGLYKVEIIGDAYFCVSGCPDNKNTNHTEKMALAAFEILATIPELQRLAGVNFELRVGIHCGPVVGGVVGVRNPRYHVFGQSVALANQMESTGQVGRVHISEAVYNKLSSSKLFLFEKCPEIHINGFGNQQTYFITANKKNDLYHSIGTLYIRVIEAKDLPKLDIVGSIDPYVVINIRGNSDSEKQRTLSSHGYNAKWGKHMNSILKLKYKGYKLIYGSDPHIDVLVRDKDDMTADDFCGKFEVPLSKLFDLDKESEDGYSEWFDLQNEKNEKSQGQIHLHLSYLTRENPNHSSHFDKLESDIDEASNEVSEGGKILKKSGSAFSTSFRKLTNNFFGKEKNVVMNTNKVSIVTPYSDDDEVENIELSP